MTTKKISVALLACSLAIVCIALVVTAGPDRTQESADSSVRAISPGSGTAIGAAPVGVPSSRAEIGIPSLTASGAPVAAAEFTRGLLEQDSLEVVLASTLTGHMDPGAFLDIGLALSKLEVSERANPVADVSGAMRYQILGTPAGVSAELFVDRSSSTEFASPVLSYHLTIAPPAAGYVMEGAVRDRIETEITLWSGYDGNVKNFAVVTSFQVSRESSKIGLGMDGRVIPTGMHFSYDATAPLEWKLSDCGVNNYAPTSSKSFATIHGVWPRVDDLKLLKSGLLNQYSKL